MAVKPQHVTDAELAILKVVWERESATAREIRDQLYPVGTPSDHATVQKLLQRIEKKGLISRDRSSFAHVFRAKVSRSTLAGQQLDAMAEKLTDGSMVPFLMHLVGGKKLSARERQELRDYLDHRK